MSTFKLKPPLVPTVDDMPSSARDATSYCGRRVRMNVWGNLNGYLGPSKAAMFGTRADLACEWLKDGYRKPAGTTSLKRPDTTP